MKFKLSLLFCFLFISLQLITPRLAHNAELPNDIPGLIHLYSDIYGVDKDIIDTVIECESQFNPRALGDNGHSRGLAQIHNLYHLDVSDEEAYDPEFSINFLAKNLAEGKGKLWSCYRKNYPQK